MCGICGVVRSAERDMVERINAAMVHRGPDDAGIHVDGAGGCVLGARRLSIIDVDGGHQPVANEDGSIWAVMNGEIYNHPSLQRDLRAHGHVLRSDTDTEVLVHLYEEYGDEMVHALRGMFAFAVWDSRRRRLLLARDRFGEKPLFYSQQRDGATVFASDSESLIRGLAQRPQLRPEAMDDFLLLGYIPGPGTIHDGIRQLPPAHRLVIEPGQDAVPERYWHSRIDGEAVISSHLAVEEVEHLLDESVRSQLVADVPLGVFLSGGVDSTLVAALAARSRSSLHTFSVGYEVGTVDERAAARQAAGWIGSIHEEVVLGIDEVEAATERALSAVDQPLADQALVALAHLARVARPHITVALGGEGGDELFAGYSRYRRLGLLGTVRSNRLLGVAARAGTRAGGRRGVQLRAGIDAPSLALASLELTTGGRASQRHDLRGRLLATMPAARTAEFEMADQPDLLRRLIEVDQTRWLPDDVLVKADRASMAASLELRAPLLDLRVAEFAGMIPLAMHLRGRGKSLLRGVLSRVLPQAGTGPQKAGFLVPAADWLRGPLRLMFEDTVLSGGVIRDGWIDGPAVQRFWKAHLGGSDMSALLWPALALGHFMERTRG